MTRKPALDVTACILCSQNCGLQVTLEDGRFTRIVGDRGHPSTKGYICQKAARLDWYQNHGDRLNTPLRRRPDGSFEAITWDTAIREIAERLVAIRDTHGGEALAYYGGGGQGNHLGGAYAAPLRAAMGTRYYYSALAQEKTGDFWVNGKLFGRQTCHVSEDIESAQCVVFIGTNPWQSHGITRARRQLTAIHQDPNRTMIVIDPVRSETAALADLHLSLQPGSDALVLSALLAVLVQEDLVDRQFIDARTVGFDLVSERLSAVDVADHCARAGVAEADLRQAAHLIASARSACVRVDLGLQQSLNSTLNSYLEKLLYLLTGNFAKAGGNNLHSFLVPLIGHSPAADSGEDVLRTQVTGFPEITKLFPPNVLPKEIDSDHPGRTRGLVVDSANPIRSGADAQAYKAAFEKLELCVVIDVAMTETAQAAHYVLPAASQFEKWEATAFSLSFPTNYFHLRAPVLPALEGTLAEPEIYRRLVVAMGELPESHPVLRGVAKLDRRQPGLRLFPAAFSGYLKARPRLLPYAALILYDTLGRALPDGAAAAAVLWPAAHIYATKHEAAVRRVGLEGAGHELGEALFARVLDSRSGAVLSTHEYEDVWSMLRHSDGKVHLAIEQLLDDLDEVRRGASHDEDDSFPLLLIAGERRSYNANTIYRNPAWRCTDPDGALRIHPDDAEQYGVSDGCRVRCASRRGSVEASVEVSERCPAGVVTLPHGYGLDYPDAHGVRRVTGPVLNDLTDSDHCDPLTATPYHKQVRVRLKVL